MHQRLQFDISDPPYGWQAAWDLEQVPGAYRIRLGLALRFARRIAPADQTAFRHKCAIALARYFDRRFMLYQDDATALPLTLELDWTHPQPHRSLPVAEGFRYGALDQWYLDWTVVDIAHELGHALGLVDEYRDPDSVARQHFATDAVRQDHSLMGDYRQEGPVYAALRLRHGQRWANWIGAALDQPLQAAYSRHYRTCPGDSLGQIAARLYGNDRMRYALQTANAQLVPNLDDLTEGLDLVLPDHG